MRRRTGLDAGDAWISSARAFDVRRLDQVMMKEDEARPAAAAGVWPSFPDGSVTVLVVRPRWEWAEEGNGGEQRGVTFAVRPGWVGGRAHIGDPPRKRVGDVCWFVHEDI